MKYDFIIMNPPYDRNLHLEILSKTMETLLDDKGVCINLSPIRWLQDPLVGYKPSSDWNKYENIRNSLKSLHKISKGDVFNLFNITNSESLGIYEITKTGGLDTSSFNSLIRKCYNRIKDNLCIIEHEKQDGWRVRISLIANSNHRKPQVSNSLGKLVVFYNGMKNGKPWYSFYQKNKWSKTTPFITDSIHFNTEREANNFINSVENTVFGKWYEHNIITGMNISNKSILWMEDYTEPWTDERFKKFFNITDSEWQEILETMKPYIDD